MFEKLKIGEKLQYGNDELELVERRSCNDKSIDQMVFYSTKSYDPETNRRQQYEIITDLSNNESTFIEQIIDLTDNVDNITVDGKTYEYMNDLSYKINDVQGKSDDKLATGEELVYGVFLNNENENDCVIRADYPGNTVLYFVDRELNMNTLKKAKKKSGIGRFFLFIFILLLCAVAFVVASYAFKPELLESIETATGVEIISVLNNLFGR